MSTTMRIRMTQSAPLVPLLLALIIAVTTSAESIDDTNTIILTGVMNLRDSFQNRSQNKGAKTEGPGLAVDPSWTDFVSHDGRFKIRMPGKPDSASSTYKSQGRQVIHRSNMASQGGVTCIVDYADIGTGYSSSESLKGLLDYCRDQIIRDSQGTIVDEKSILVADMNGREFSFKLFGGTGTARVFLLNGRLYQLVILTIDALVSHIDQAAIFFSSFHILEESKVAVNAIPTENSHVEVPP